MYEQEQVERLEVIDESKLQEFENCIVYDKENFSNASFKLQECLEDLFQKSLNLPHYLHRVHVVLERMSKHPDSRMRLLLMTKLPRLAFLCRGVDLSQYVDNHLCPLLLSCLNDSKREVRKACEFSLLAIIKARLFAQEVVHEKVCPCVAQICNYFSYVSTVALIGKLAPLIGKEATEKHFLAAFVQCAKQRTAIRKICVKNLGELCTVLGRESTEKHLLHPFINFCRDNSVDVRISCPEAIVLVSCNCSMTSRKSYLADAFVDLLQDVSREVKISAYRVLGAFIFTFTDPDIKRIESGGNEDLRLVGQEGFEFRVPSFVDFQDFHFVEETNLDYELLGQLTCPGGGDQPASSASPLRLFFQRNASRLNSSEIISNLELSHPTMSSASWSSGDNWNKTWNVASEKEEEEEEEESSNLFNSFRFWRVPLPSLDSLETEPEQDDIRLDLNTLDNELTTLSEKWAEYTTDDLEEIKPESWVACPTFSSDSIWYNAETNSYIDSGSVTNTKISGPSNQEAKSQGANETSILPKQEKVPQILLDSFVSMKLPKEVCEDLVQNRSYYFLAVALTLGPSNWPYIRNTYKCLSMNIQWKVRKIAVSSIHQLASVVGEEIASKDLAPIFERFLGDLDEVKVGAVEHLADFLKLVSPSTRKEFLPRLKILLETDFDYNWRYREEFSRQLQLLIKLYNPSDWLEYFKPLATVLLCDKVAEVRNNAVLLYVDLLVNLASEPESQGKLLCLLKNEFAENTSWRKRQVFVHLCSKAAQQNAVDKNVFCQHILDPLLLLSEDTVPNVGLCVARCLSQDIICTGYMDSSDSQYTSILNTLEKLKDSKDPDIRHFALFYKNDGENRES